MTSLVEKAWMAVCMYDLVFKTASVAVCMYDLVGQNGLGGCMHVYV